jgi:hypothetical protein
MQFLLPYTGMASSKTIMDDNLHSAVDIPERRLSHEDWLN